MSEPKPPSTRWALLTQNSELRARWRAFCDRYARQPALTCTQELLPVPSVMVPVTAPAITDVPVTGA